MNSLRTAFIPTTAGGWLFVVCAIFVGALQIVVRTVDVPYEWLVWVGGFLSTPTSVWIIAGLVVVPYVYFFVYAAHHLAVDLFHSIEAVVSKQTTARLRLLNGVNTFFAIMILIPIGSAIFKMIGLPVWSHETVWLAWTCFWAGCVGWLMTQAFLRSRD